jgi:hypothetical protein
MFESWLAGFAFGLANGIYTENCPENTDGRGEA